MTGLCRTLLLVLVTAGLCLGLPAAAQAAFSDSVTAPAVTVSTVTVAAPTNVTAQQINCGSNGRWQDVQLTWAPSTTAKISGYRVIIYSGNGSIAATAEVSAGATGAIIGTDKFSSSMSFAVTTRTSYGWTKESTRTGALPC